MIRDIEDDPAWQEARARLAALDLAASDEAVDEDEEVAVAAPSRRPLRRIVRPPSGVGNPTSAPIPPTAPRPSSGGTGVPIPPPPGSPSGGTSPAGSPEPPPLRAEPTAGPTTTSKGGSMSMREVIDAAKKKEAAAADKQEEEAFEWLLRYYSASDGRKPILMAEADKMGIKTHPLIAAILNAGKPTDLESKVQELMRFATLNGVPEGEAASNLNYILGVLFPDAKDDVAKAIGRPVNELTGGTAAVGGLAKPKADDAKLDLFVVAAVASVKAEIARAKAAKEELEVETLLAKVKSLAASADLELTDKQVEGIVNRSIKES